MIKKLSLVFILLASFYVAGYALTVSAEEGSVTVSTEATVTTDDQDTDDDQKGDDDSDKDDMSKPEDRGGWWGNREVREQRQELRDDRAGLVKLFQAKKTEFKAQIEARKDAREDMQQNRRGLIESRWNMLAVRFENVVNRIESRIAKMKDAGMDVAAAETHVANAKASVQAAKDAAAALAASAEGTTLTKDVVMKAKADIKADLESAKSELKLAVQVLVSLQAESSNKEDQE